MQTTSSTPPPSPRLSVAACPPKSSHTFRENPRKAGLTAQSPQSPLPTGTAGGNLFSFSSGNEQMKVENFEAAVHFYGKAIELNPANAVYFCNRYWPGAHRRGACPVA